MNGWLNGYLIRYLTYVTYRVIVPACYWKAVAVTVILTDPVMERMPNNLTVIATGNRTGTTSKTIPYFPVLTYASIQSKYQVLFYFY